MSYSDNIHKHIVVDRRESKYLHELRVGFNETEPASACKMRKSLGEVKTLAARKLTGGSAISDDSFDELNMISPHYIESRIQSVQKNVKIGEDDEEDEEDKNSDTYEETKVEDDTDALDQYLKKLGKSKVSKESPVIPDDNKIEVGEHRKSGKSISPPRSTIKKVVLLPSGYKDSTNIPLTSSLSSEDYANQQEQEENFILRELEELYDVFLSWIFSSRYDPDTSRPIRYQMMLQLCLNLAAKSTKLMKQKAISDFNFMTAVEKNAMVIMSERTFARWMLDLLYSVFPPKNDLEKDPIWEMGCKLYVQINKTCFSIDE